MRKICAVLFVSLSLFGCINNGTPPQSFYYLLDAHYISNKDSAAINANDVIIANKVVTNIGSDAQTQIKILPVNLPGYLNQPNLILKLSNHQIKIANYHFWAEDVDQSIQRILISELSKINSAISYTTRCETCKQLAVNIDHFYPTERGEVVLSGSYETINPQNLPHNLPQHEMTQLTMTQTVQFSFTQKLNNGGYDEAVEVMRSLLGELANEIARDTIGKPL